MFLDLSSLFLCQTLICDVHAMTSDHHKWTQVKNQIK